MNHLVFSADLTSLSAFILGLFVLLKNPRNKLNQIFTSYSWSITLWSSCFSQLHTVPPSWGVHYGRLLHFGCTFIPVLFFHFAVALSGEFERKKLQVFSAYTIAIGYNLLNSFPGFFTDEIIYRLGYAYPRPIGLIYLSYFIFFVALVTFGLITLLRILPSLPRDRAKGLLLFILMTALGYLGGLNNFLIMIDVHFFPLFPYGLYAVALYCVVTGFVANEHPFSFLQPVKHPPTDKLASSTIPASQSSSLPLEVDVKLKR